MEDFTPEEIERMEHEWLAANPPTQVPDPNYVEDTDGPTIFPSETDDVGPAES